jgi:TolB-like protein
MVGGAIPLAKVTQVPEQGLEAHYLMSEMEKRNYFSRPAGRVELARGTLTFRFGVFEMDVARRELQRAGAIVHLEPQVFDLIVHLIQNRDRIVSKDELMETIWHGRIVSEAALSSRVSSARRALGDSGDDQSLIRTRQKCGFRFVGELSGSTVLPSGPRSSQQIAATDAPKIVPNAEPSCRGPGKPSIAVLPFDNKSSDSDHEYFADGLTVDIITGLSQQHSFFVIARNSILSYKGHAVDVRDVATRLGVRYVLQGSVRKAEDRVRVTAQLIDATNGAHWWGEKYDRELADIFAVQDDIAARVIGSVGLQILVAERARTRTKTAFLSPGVASCSSSGSVEEGLGLV